MYLGVDPLHPTELAEKTSATFDSSTKEYLILEFEVHTEKTELKFKRKATKDEVFDRGSHELRNSKEDVLNLLSSIESVEDLRMHGFIDLNEEMLNALMKINFGTLTVTQSRVTSSFDALIDFLKMKKNKVVMKLDLMYPNIITDEVLVLLKKPIILQDFSKGYETPTGLTDEYLANLNFRKGGVDKKIDLDYWNPCLTFGAIKKLAEETKARWDCYHIVENNFGLLGVEYIEEIAEYVRSQRAKKIKICCGGIGGQTNAVKHKKMLYCINGNSILKFTDFFEKWCFKNGFSLPLDEISDVDMATLVDPNAFEMFRNIKDVLFAENDSIDGIPKAQYQFETVRFMPDWFAAEHSLVIFAEGQSHVPFMFRRSSKDCSEVCEKTMAKFIQMCSHIDWIYFGDIILTDELYGLLSENAPSTTIGENWNMTDSLSTENRATLKENRTKGLFEKFQFTEEIPSLSEEDSSMESESTQSDSDEEIPSLSEEESSMESESTQSDSDEDGSQTKESDLDKSSKSNNDVDDDMSELSDNNDVYCESTNELEISSGEESSTDDSDGDAGSTDYDEVRIDYHFFNHEKM